MAKVNRYRQNDLADSAVGAPGADNSGAMLAQSGLGNALDLADSIVTNQRQTRNVGSQVASQLVQGFGDAVKAVAAVGTKQQALLNGMAVDRHGSALNMGLDDIANQVQTEYKDSPELASKAYQKKSQEYVKNYLRENNLDANAEVYAAVQKHGLSKVNSDYSAMGNWALSRATTNAVDNLRFTAQRFAERAGTLDGNLVRLKDLHDEADQLVGSYRTAYGAADAGEEMHKTHTAIDKQFIAGLIPTNPTEAKRLLETGYFRGAVDNDDVNKYMKQAESELKAQQKNQEDNDRMEADKYSTSIQSLYWSGRNTEDPRKVESVLRDMQSKLEAVQKQPYNPYKKEQMNEIGGNITALQSRLTYLNDAPKREQREQRTLDAAERAAENQRRSALALEEANRIKAQQAHLASPEAQQARVKALTLYRQLPSIAAVRSGKFSMDEALKLTYQFTQEVKKADDVKALGLDGKVHSEWEEMLAQTNAIRVAAQAQLKVPSPTVTKDSFADALKIFERTSVTTAPADPFVHDVHQTHGNPGRAADLDLTIKREIIDNVNAYKAKFGEDPSPAQLRAIQQAVNKRHAR